MNRKIIISVCAIFFALTSVCLAQRGRGANAGMAPGVPAQISSYSFQQRDQLATMLEDRISMLENELNQVRNATQDNWVSVRESAGQTLREVCRGQISRQEQYPPQLPESPGMGDAPANSPVIDDNPSR